MIKTLLLVAALFLVPSGAFAACTNPMAITANAGTVNMSVSQNTADAGCMYNITPNQGGVPLSATNGWWTNILQGNVALSATNGLYANILQGNVANSAANPFFFAPATSSVWSISAASGTDVSEGGTGDTACPASGVATLVGCARSLTQAATTPLNNSSAPINVSTATTTQLVALSGSTAIYVTSYDVIAGGTGNITFEYGTGTACATGTTALTGPYNLTAQAGLAKGAGIGTVLKVPAGNALCVLTSAAVQMSGSVSFQQF
jgi:hypothetical protein